MTITTVESSPKNYSSHDYHNFGELFKIIHRMTITTVESSHAMKWEMRRKKISCLFRQEIFLVFYETKISDDYSSLVFFLRGAFGVSSFASTSGSA